MARVEASDPQAQLLHYREQVAQLERHADAASRGRPLARARAAALDRTILAIVAPTGASADWALVAAGGYGRGELSPKSDVDLLVLTRRRAPDVEAASTRLFYALWDAGFETTPSVRTLAECLSLAARDLAAQTASFQSRLLFGDADLFDEYQRRAFADARREGGKAFLKSLLADVRARHSRFAEAAYGIEPDVKEGRGGLRDAQALEWAGLVAYGADGAAELARLGHLAADEAAALAEATDFLLRVRDYLHRLSGRRTDRLYFAYQEEIAASLRYANTAERLAVESLMRDLNAHAAAISWSAEGFWEKLEASLLAGWRGLRLGQKAKPPGDEALAAEPGAAMRLFADAASRGMPVGHQAARQIRASLAGAPASDAWPADVRESFLAVLRSGDVAASLLETMAGSGLLGQYIPEWESIRYLAHHDVYHQHTVDRHSGLVVRELGLMAAGQGPDGVLFGALAADLPSLDPLLLAGLLHDLGKGRPGDHEVTGAALARGIGARMDLDPEDRETVAWLISEHLTLARAATRRDLDDEALIRRLAEAVGTPDRLRMLYLLTVADSRSTGPSAWTDWKAALVRDLFFRILRCLQGNDDEAPESVVQTRITAVRRALGDMRSGVVDEFLDSMPPTYLLAQSFLAIREHVKLLTEAPGTFQIVFHQLADGGATELTLVGPDHPGMLWRICGVFALHGVNVLEARAYTGSKGQVVDVFRLADAFEPAIPEEKTAALTRDLPLALAGRLSIGYRLGRKLRHYRPGKPEPGVKTRVAIDNAASASYTVVEVHARDRLGLLYAITRVLADLQLDIHLAKVATRGPAAIDAFYVQDLSGQKVTDPEHMKELEQAILFELTEFEIDSK